LGRPFLAARGLLSADGAFAATSIALGDTALYIEDFPTSPLILSPFTDPLPVPKALRPEPKALIGEMKDPPGPWIRPAELAAQPAASAVVQRHPR
jgi:hypothetical protein